MKILYIALKYDYGKVERGFSFEHYNFYDSLVKMENGKHQIVYFPVDEIIKEKGYEEMNKQLIETVKSEKPDLCFFFLLTDEIAKETIKKITDSGFVTYNWFADDHFRFFNFTKYYAPLFTWASTTDSQAIKRYNAIGYKNVIKTQWACNHFLYRPSKNLPVNNFDYEVTFVGAPHVNRKEAVETIINAGLKIDCFGGGWPHGRVSQEKMMDIFTGSKINLNFTKSYAGLNIKSISKIFFKKKNERINLDAPWNWVGNFQSFLARNVDQIKGRTFEVPGCGGFLISGRADNIESYYIPDKEMVYFDTTSELIEKIKYYLEHENERQNIALAGYERTIHDHTYEERFKQIFKIIGF